MTPSGHKWAYFRRNIKYLYRYTYAFNKYLLIMHYMPGWGFNDKKREKNSPSPGVDCETGKADNFRQKMTIN